MATSELSILVQVKDQASQAMKGISGSLKGMENDFKTLASVGTVGFAAVSSVIYKTLQSSMEAEVQMANFNTTMKSLVGTSVEVATGISKTVTQFKLTGAAAEEVKIALKEKTLALEKVKKEYNSGKITSQEYALVVEKTKNQISILNEKLGETKSSTVNLTKNIKITKEQVQAASESFIKASGSVRNLGFDDEAAAVSMSKFFQRTGDVTQSIKLNTVAMDLARTKQVDYNTAVGLVSQVLAGNGRVLKQYGIDIKDTASPLEAIGILADKVKGQAASFAETTQGKIEVLKYTVDDLSQAIGDTLKSSLAGIVEQVQPIIAKIQQWVEVNPELTKRIVLAATAITGLVAVIGLLGIAMPGIITGFTLLTGPVGLTVIVISALVAGFILFREKVTEVFNTLDEKTGIITFLKDAWQSIVDTFNNNLLPALKELWEVLLPYKPFIETLAKVFGTIFVIAILGVVKAIEGWILIFVELVSQGIKFITWVTEKLTPVFTAIGEKIIWVIEKVEALIGAFSRLNIVQGAKNLIGGAIGGAKDFIGNVIGGAKGLIGLASGGIVTSPTLAMIGEGGEPEAVIPLSKLSGMGGGIIVNINGGTYLSESAAGELGDMIINQLKLNMKI